MSEPANETVESAFGTSFESALEAAFAEAGTTIEPSSPKPDVVVEKVPPAVEPAPVKPAAVPATIEEVEDKEEHDILLPIDEEVPEVEEEPDTTGMTKTASERFKALRTEQKALKTELATKVQAEAAALARVKELEAITGNAEQLKQELEALKLKQAVYAIEDTPEYQAAVTKPMADLAATAKAIAAKHSIDINKLLDAIAIEDQSEQDDAFDDLLTGVGDRDKIKVFALAEQLPAIMAERAKLQANSEQVTAELAARRQVEEQAAIVEAAKTRKAAVDLVAVRVAAALPFLKESDKFSLDTVKSKTADMDFDSADVTTKAYNAYAGHLIPQLAKAYSLSVKEIESLTDELAKYKKATPAVKGNAAAPASAADSNLSFAQAVEAAFAAA
jgi:hypothetical protein